MTRFGATRAVVTMMLGGALGCAAPTPPGVIRDHSIIADAATDDAATSDLAVVAASDLVTAFDLAMLVDATTPDDVPSYFDLVGFGADLPVAVTDLVPPPPDKSPAVDVKPSDAAVAAADLTGRPADLKGTVVDAVATPDLTMPASMPDLSSSPDLVPGCGTVQATCDTVMQNCCANLKCGLNSSNAVCMANGAVANNQKCTYPDNCVRGNVCATPSKLNNNSYCFQFCNNDTDCTSHGRCGSITVNGFNVCSPPITNCDVFTQPGSCGAGNGCFPVDKDADTGCHAAGSIKTNAGLCSSDYDCAAGNICVQSFCRKFCSSLMTCPCIFIGNGSFGYCLF